jgi:hypothetical protein
MMEWKKSLFINIKKYVKYIPFPKRTNDTTSNFNNYGTSCPIIFVQTLHVIENVTKNTSIKLYKKYTGTAGEIERPF